MPHNSRHCAVHNLSDITVLVSARFHYEAPKYCFAKQWHCFQVYVILVMSSLSHRRLFCMSKWQGTVVDDLDLAVSECLGSKRCMFFYRLYILNILQPYSTGNQCHLHL